MMPFATDRALPKSGGVWKSEAFHRFLLIACACVFALVLFEIPALLNILDYHSLELSGVWANPRFIRNVDPELRHIQPAHAHYIGASQGGDIESSYDVPAADRTPFHWDLRYDWHGFRNATDLQSAGIAMIGDSLIEGMTIPAPQIVSSLLANSQGDTVANFGQFGYGPQQELVVLRRYGLPLHPHTVVWLFSEATDLSDAVGYRDLMRDPPGFWTFFVQRSFTRAVYHAFGRLFAPSKPPANQRLGVATASGADPLRIYFSFPAHPLTAEEMSGLDETRRAVSAANQLSVAQGAHFVFVYAPEKFRVFHDFCQFPTESECRNWVLSDLPNVMRTTITGISPDIGYLDLTPALTDAVKRGASPFYNDDGHWSPEGHRVVAEAIHQYLTHATPVH
jgi:hypothetical protein